MIRRRPPLPIPGLCSRLGPLRQYLYRAEDRRQVLAAFRFFDVTGEPSTRLWPSGRSASARTTDFLPISSAPVAQAAHHERYRALLRRGALPHQAHGLLRQRGQRRPYIYTIINGYNERQQWRNCTLRLFTHADGHHPLGSICRHEVKTSYIMPPLHGREGHQDTIYFSKRATPQG